MSKNGRKITGFSEAGVPIYEDEVLEPWIDLATAVYKQAEKDYVDAYKKLLCSENRKTLKEMQDQKDELEAFFREGWLTETLEIDGGWILKKLRKQAIKKVKEQIEKKVRL